MCRRLAVLLVSGGLGAAAPAAGGVVPPAMAAPMVGGTAPAAVAGPPAMAAPMVAGTAPAAVAGAPGPPAAASMASAAPSAWTPGVAAARAFAGRRAGTVSFAVRTPSRAYAVRGDRAARSASVVKAMLMVAYLLRGDVRSRALTAADRGLLDPMIRRSDNDTASRTFAIVGTPGLQQVARAARMRRFVSGGAFWGSSQITAADQARFFERIDARIPARHRAYAMGLLRTIVPAQRWGVGRVRPAGWTLYLKGGWGSGSGAVDHQVALLRRDRARVSLAILTTDNPSMAYGNATLEGVAARLLRGLDVRLVGTVADAPVFGVAGSGASSAPEPQRFGGFQRVLSRLGYRSLPGLEV